LAQDPHSADAHANLAAALQALQRHDEAVLCYERALALDPGSAEASHGLATVLKALERYDEAIRHYEMALAVTAARSGVGGPTAIYCGPCSKRSAHRGKGFTPTAQNGPPCQSYPDCVLRSSGIN
jgi:tetratricopeptide (TPR) repeat protein